MRTWLIAVATVASLIYVATQIRENTSRNKRQALEKIIDQVIDWGVRLNDNPKNLENYLRGLEEFASFDTQTSYNYHLSMFELSVACEAVLEHAKSKSIKEETVHAINDRMKYELRAAGARCWWFEMGSKQLSTDFVVHVNYLLEDQPAQAQVSV